jgi:hypothetical protein
MMTGPYSYRALAFCVHWCLVYERHLFKDAEIQKLADFQSLSAAAQWLYARLFFRKDFASGRWFRVSSLGTRYGDINVEKAVMELSQRCFLKEKPSSTEEYLALAKSLTKSELTRLGQELGLQSSCMLRTSISGTLFPQANGCLTPAQLALERQALPAVSGVQQATEAMRTAWAAMAPLDIGNALRNGLELSESSPPCLVTQPLFSSRAALEQYIAARQLEDSFQVLCPLSAANALTCAERAEEMLRELTSDDCPTQRKQRVMRYDQLCSLSDVYRERYTAVGILSNILWHSISILESSGKFAAAVSRLELLLESSCSLRRRGKFYDRLSLIYLNRFNDSKKAFSVCVEAQSDEFVRVVELHTLLKRAARINGTLCFPVTDDAVSVALVIPERFLPGRALQSASSRGGAVKFAGLDNAVGISVESLALQFYESEQGFRGIHLEGGAFEVIFLICLGDLLDMPVPDVFHAPCQLTPLDFGTEVFYNNRRELIHRRLAELHLLSASELIEWSNKRLNQEQARIIKQHAWFTRVPWSTVIAGLGGRGLIRILARLVTDFYYWRSGVPDLLLWQCDETPRCKLVEVKSAKDSLSAKQRHWLQELCASGVDVEICHIREHGRYRKRAVASKQIVESE